MHISTVEASNNRYLHSRLSAPAVDVVQHWFLLPLFVVGQLNHTDGVLGTIEFVQKILLHLTLAIEGLRLQVEIPIKGYTFQCLAKLFYH